MGPVIFKYLPQLHAITGCNTTCYFYRVGKINPLKRVLKSSNCLQLLAGLGKESFDDESQLDAMKFIQTILYCGTDEEDYVSTQVRLYKKQKQKSSLTIPPDRPVASLNNQGGQHSLHGENIGAYTVVRTKLSFIGGALAPFAPPPP